ncbi:hypothetical protein NDJ00_11965 [Vibrio parahaemolyticus]|uniref:hypothetical protein n=1 Tax=Vibrio parahaemolyticus TaxID=670 RepID=UPI00215F5AD3|nr:hypothetical protein [Vibrio parahaemolyticus]MCS0114887.1 hypothetical protein [Vibrio parahaemolyticus]
MRRKPLASDDNYSAAQAIYDLLKKATLKPKYFIDDQEFKNALKSQGGIARLSGEWTFDDITIKKKEVSLNTLKKYSGLLFNRGFEQVDEQRSKALGAIEEELTKGDKPTRRTKKGLEIMIDDLEDALLKHKKTNFILLTALSSAISNINSVASADNKKLRVQRADHAVERLRAIVSLNNPPFDELSSDKNVVNLAEYTDEKK